MAVPQKHTWVTTERLDKFLSTTYWTDCNLKAAEDVRTKSLPPGTALRARALSLPQTSTDEVFPTRMTFSEAVDAFKVPQSRATDVKVGDSFGPLNTTHWFELVILAPSAAFEAIDESDWELQWHTGAEGLVYSATGEIICGLTGGGRDFVALSTLAAYSTSLERTQIASPAGFRRCRLYLEMACNSLCGDGAMTMISRPDYDRRFTLTKAALVKVGPDLRQLRLDLTIMHELATANKDSMNDIVAAEALSAANDAINQFHFDDPASHGRALATTAAFFARVASASSAEPLHTVHAMGHCHIDCAWLWRYCESRRKAARSWASQMHLNEHLPLKFHFAVSQAVQMHWVQQDYPQLFDRLRKSASDGGLFCPTGATWVECDGNLPSGESFMRQFFYGQQFHQRQFGAPCDVFWLPDTFGYSGQLPQVAKLHGVKYFMSQKLSWNLINKPPHTTFWWQGIDGKRSTLLAHFPPTDTYGSTLGVGDVLKHGSNKSNKDLAECRHSMLLFGHGDGGGGPTEEMLRRLSRFESVSSAACGVKINLSSTPSSFFHTIEREEATLRRLQRHVGELYFELHRGTLTSVTRLKRANIKCQSSLRTAEFLATWQFLDDPSFVYPHEQLADLWRVLLLQQFHDVLPGSSIGDVNTDAMKQFDTVRNGALAISARCAATDVFVNSTSFPLVGHRDNALLSSCIAESEAKEFPPWSTSTLTPFPVSPRPVSFTVENGSDDATVIEFPAYRCVVSQTGVIESFRLKASDGTLRAEMVGPERWNVLRMYDDVPLFWDAWDVEVYHTEKPIEMPESTHPTELRQNTTSCTFRYRCVLSDCSHVDVVLHFDEAPRVCVFAEADWHEKHRILKLECDTTITSTFATFDIQFGKVDRPTHVNSSHDSARFETSLQRWFNLSEPGLGVAVVQANGMHAATVRGSMMSLSLVRAPTSPDPDADRGKHEWCFTILPHTGDLAAAALDAEAACHELRSDWITAKRRVPVTSQQLFASSPAHVVVSSVRVEEDRVVVHCYESQGRQAVDATVQFFDRPILEAHLCDGLLRPLRKLAVEGDTARLGPLAAFEVVVVVLNIQRR
jgi:alpha-mannosidase